MINSTQRHPLVLGILTSAIILMAGTSIYMRIKTPGLTNTAIPEENRAMPPSIGEMDTIGQLMKLASEKPGDLSVITRLTEALLSAGQWDAAENFAQKGLNISQASQKDPRLLYLLALVHHNKGQHQLAAEVLEKLLADNENPSARYSLGILYTYFLNRPEAGKEQFIKASEMKDLSPALQKALQEELDKISAPQQPRD